MQDSPSNVKEGDVIQALDDLPLHLADCHRVPCYPETELRRPPILLNEVEFAVILGVEITQVPTRLDQLLKLGLLRGEVGLRKKDAPATAVSVVRGAMKTRALGEEVFLGPQTTLLNDDLHAFEPTGHGGVVFREIE